MDDRVSQLASVPLLPHWVSFQAIGTGSGVLGFRLCWCPSRSRGAHEAEISFKISALARLLAANVTTRLQHTPYCAHLNGSVSAMLLAKQIIMILKGFNLI